MGQFIVAVDVGTGSARSGLYDRAGKLVARSEHPIEMLREDGVYCQHASADIWQAVCYCVNDVVTKAAIDKGEIDAIGFDATCSLVVLDGDGTALPVRSSLPDKWDTISWLDHRADEQARALSNCTSEALRHVGGIMSPEMQLPKLLWLKAHLPETWERAGLIFDLADFLVWKACDATTRSVCTLSAKWTFLAHSNENWDISFLKQAGLEDLRVRAGIPPGSGQIGRPAGRIGIEAAGQLGLAEGTLVAFGMVDAFAGVVSALGDKPDEPQRAALIGGTSSCVMRLSDDPVFLRSFWGPFFGAAVPGKWIIEGGQTATGALLDHILQTQGSRYGAGKATHENILARIDELRAIEGATFARGIHVLPDFLGNRSPIGDPQSRGVIHGLSMDGSFDALSRLYWRSMVAMALSVRQLVEVMEGAGLPIAELVLGGGHARNSALAQLYADATGKQIILSGGDEAMLLGSAMVAATSAGWHDDLASACRAMKRNETVLSPQTAMQTELDRDYQVFLQMQAHREVIQDMTNG